MQTHEAIDKAGDTLVRKSVGEIEILETRNRPGKGRSSPNHDRHDEFGERDGLLQLPSAPLRFDGVSRNRVQERLARADAGSQLVLPVVADLEPIIPPGLEAALGQSLRQLGDQNGIDVGVADEESQDLEFYWERADVLHPPR